MSDAAEKETNPKYKSRKWIVTVWAMLMASVIILAVFACSFTGYNVPDGAITLAGVLSSTGLAYIGGNTYAKTHTTTGD
ncbi:MAG: hypothetical protein MJZ25_13080 [Fibrobacter sp.]|nr:hypothetical protein [Fibrobacter sp.]